MIHSPILLRRSMALCSAVGLAGFPLAIRAGELKIDINRDTKNLDSVTEVGYAKWSPDTSGGATAGTAATTRTFTSATGETVSVSFSQTALSQSRGGTGLFSNWYQVGAQGTARLVSDGFSVAPANLATGGQIQMTITGLAPGHHTLLTYHNHWDALAAGTLGPLDVFVNGTLVVDNLQPTIRAATNLAAPIAYVEFDVAAPADITTVLFAAETSVAGAVTIRNPTINGFEIDTPNSTRIASTPSPADADEHVDGDAGSTALNWGAALAGNAASHDVYFGTSQSAVRNATRAAPEFKGNQTATSGVATGLSSLLTYYWRIDEIDSLGNATKGTVWYFRTRHLAFPTAEGFGRFARGGRGGRVVEVTSLADYLTTDAPIPGTLRYAIEQETGPRTIVFRVSGLITLLSRLTLASPYVTIAGQTAPGKGICLRNFTLGLSGARDAIVRHVRSRPGNLSGTTIDGMGMSGCDHSIMDHCSISWSLDEAFSSRSAKNITLQRCLISEALNVAGHQNYPPGTAHGYAASIGGDAGSFHHNLLAHNYGRNWSLAGGLDGAGFFAGRLDIRNNVVYNWGHRTTDGGAMEVNFVNNYYKPGAATDYFFALNAQYDNFPGTQRYHFAGNVMPGHFTEANQSAGYTQTATNGGSLPTYPNFLSTPFFTGSFVTTQSATEAYQRVLSDVGCNQPWIDDHDLRVIAETRDGTFTYRGSISNLPGLPDSQADVGGWESYPAQTRPADWDSDHDGLPDWWETIFALNPGSTPGDYSETNADPDDDGYVRLDDYLAWMARPHVECLAGAHVDVDLRRLTTGYSNAPIHAASGASVGTVELLDDGHSARFTPPAAFTGLATYDFTVSDAAGDVMPRTIGVLVTTALTTKPRLVATSAPPGRALEFIGSVGVIYRVRHSTDLAAWNDWFTLTASGSAQTIAIPAALSTAPRRYFRIEQ